MTESKKILKIPRAFLGEFAKEVVDLNLEYTGESLELVAQNPEEAQFLPKPWLWKSITGIDLRYTPLGLQRIILEVDLTRQRKTTKSLTEDSFIVLFFQSSDIPIVEELLETHNLTSLVKEGISDFLLTPPFSYIYSTRVRKTMNIIAKISRIFVVLCFLYSLLKWLFYCNPEDVQSGEKCVTYLSLFHSLIVSLLNFAYGVIVSPLLQFFEYLLSPFPKIKYIILAMFSLVLLPLWPLFMIWGSIMFLSDFVIRFHILFYVWDAISFATSNYKYLNSLFKTATQISSTIWNSFRTTKPRPQLLKKENIKSSKEKLQ